MKHCFDVEIASEVGINAAVIYENISYWVEHNKKAGRNFRDGRHWTYITQRELAEQFGYLTTKQVRTALGKLEESGYLITGSYNRHRYDRTTWYSTTGKGRREDQKGEDHLPPRAQEEAGMAQDNADEGRPIPDIKAIINKTDINTRARELAASCGAVCTV